MQEGRKGKTLLVKRKEFTQAALLSTKSVGLSEYRWGCQLLLGRSTLAGQTPFLIEQSARLCVRCAKGFLLLMLLVNFFHRIYFEHALPFLSPLPDPPFPPNFMFFLFESVPIAERWSMD